MHMWYHSKVLILQESCHEKGEVNTRGPLTTIRRAVRAVEGTSHQLGHSAAQRWEMSFLASVGWNMLKCLYHPLVCEWGDHIQSLTCMQLCLIGWSTCARVFGQLGLLGIHIPSQVAQVAPVIVGKQNSSLVVSCLIPFNQVYNDSIIPCTYQYNMIYTHTS